MKNILNSILLRPQLASFTLGALSATALSIAFIAQYMYGLAPCILCIYQRWPFGVVIVLSAISVFIFKKCPKAIRWLLGLISLTFFTNAAFAIYHTGVERKWWSSFLEACTIPKMEGNIADVLAQIQTAPLVRCDEIPWTDPILGLSMANYNVVFCVILGFLALYAALKAPPNLV
jgi:disulfide bond formation protein DsbB